MITLNIRIIEGDNIVIMRSLEFPNVIVQGKTNTEAKKEFLKALDYFFIIRTKIENKKYPLSHEEKTETLQMELISNEWW